MGKLNGIGLLASPQFSRREIGRAAEQPGAYNVTGAGRHFRAGHATPGELGQRGSDRTGGVDPSGLSGTPQSCLQLPAPRTPGPYVAADGAGARGLSAAGRSTQRKLGEPAPLL